MGIYTYIGILLELYGEMGDCFLLVHGGESASGSLPNLGQGQQMAPTGNHWGLLFRDYREDFLRIPHTLAASIPVMKSCKLLGFGDRRCKSKVHITTS